MIKKALQLLLQFFGFSSKRKNDTPVPFVFDADMLFRSTKFIKKKSKPGPLAMAQKKRKRKIRIQKQSRRINQLNSK